ncbi:hypothetical protein V1517DRAFT_195038 [Lipomyces orientalis]|uniref:Uncharacterized protein n=1 Tax=Lipomyces orientalis TaxID=1233043 RepID=A0ACC3TI90_9ASCO
MDACGVRRTPMLPRMMADRVGNIVGRMYFVGLRGCLPWLLPCFVVCSFVVCSLLCALLLCALCCVLLACSLRSRGLTEIKGGVCPRCQVKHEVLYSCNKFVYSSLHPSPVCFPESVPSTLSPRYKGEDNYLSWKQKMLLHLRAFQTGQGPGIYEPRP